MVVVLMRKEANARALTGEFAQPDKLNGDWPAKYKVVPLWETPVDSLLTGPRGLLPLAPLAKFDEAEAPRVKAVIADRLSREVDRSIGTLLITILFQLLGLKYDETRRPFWSDLMTTADFRQNFFGKLVISEDRREPLLDLGTEKFGPPSEAVSAAIAAIEDGTELRQLAERLLHVQSWDELLAG